jgi:4a-hydroxytetrahydrobiopterin dehydratase
METQTIEELAQKKCVPCEGGVPRYSRAMAARQLESLDGWQLTDDGNRIRKQWVVKNFMAGLDFFNRVGQLAEAEGHHPDLHLEGYRKVAVELSTHAIGGLSENDFILAAKIDLLPISARSPTAVK